MPGAARACENQCGYFFKTFILLMTMAAVGLSVAGSLQCQFLLVDLTTGTGWDTILNVVPDQFTSVWVGVFRWGPAINGNLVGECQYYDSFFGDSSQYFLEVAQGCAVAAPILGFVAVMISCFELICCSFFGSCIFAFILFFAASGVQMGIFGMFASPGGCADLESSDCYDSNVDPGTFWMILLSGFFFFISSLMLCCVPRPDPCLQSSSPQDHEAAGAKEQEVPTYEDPEIRHSPNSRADEQPHYVETY